MTNDKNVNAFTTFEKNRWEVSADPYHQLLGALTCQTVDILLEAVKQKQNATSLLDIATGPGYLAKCAGKYGYNEVVGIDFSEAMINIANADLNSTKSYSTSFTLPKTINFKVGDAEQLEAADNSFDSVTMNFGLLHLAHPKRALSEAYRVLKPGGKFGYTVWAKPERNIGFAILLGAIEAFIDKTISIPDGPPIFYFSEVDNSSSALQDAGFIDVSIREVPLQWVVKSGDEFFNAFLEGGARIGGLLKLQSTDTLNSIRNKIIIDSELYKKGARLHIPMSAVLAIGAKSSM